MAHAPLIDPAELDAHAGQDNSGSAIFGGHTDWLPEVPVDQLPDPPFDDFDHGNLDPDVGINIRPSNPLIATDGDSRLWDAPNTDQVGYVVATAAIAEAPDLAIVAAYGDATWLADPSDEADKLPVAARGSAATGWADPLAVAPAFVGFAVPANLISNLPDPPGTHSVRPPGGMTFRLGDLNAVTGNDITVLDDGREQTVHVQRESDGRGTTTVTISAGLEGEEAHIAMPDHMVGHVTITVADSPDPGRIAAITVSATNPIYGATGSNDFTMVVDTPFGPPIAAPTETSTVASHHPAHRIDGIPSALGTGEHTAYLRDGVWIIPEVVIEGHPDPAQWAEPVQPGAPGESPDPQSDRSQYPQQGQPPGAEPPGSGDPPASAGESAARASWWDNAAPWWQVISHLVVDPITRMQYHRTEQRIEQAIHDAGTVGHARSGFLAGMGFPITPPTDPDDLLEWTRGMDTAAAVQIAETIAGAVPMVPPGYPPEMAPAGITGFPGSSVRQGERAFTLRPPVFLATSKQLANQSIRRQAITDEIQRAAREGRPAALHKHKNWLRREGRNVYEMISGKPIPAGWDVHHRHELQDAHLYPSEYPNDPRNLVLMRDVDHRQLHAAENAMLDGRKRNLDNLNLLEHAIDQMFSDAMIALPVGPKR